MSHGNGVVAGESLPATVPDETAIAVPCHLYPAQDVVQDRKDSLAEGAFALHDSSVNGKTEEAWTKAQVAKADAVAVEAKAKARVAVAEALEAEAKAKVAEAQAATKVRVAAAEALEADLKILKLRKEIDVFTGVQLDGGDEEQRGGTVLLEDLDFNEKKNSSPRSSRFREDGSKKKRKFEVPGCARSKGKAALAAGETIVSPAQKKQKKKIEPNAMTKASLRVPKRPERGLGCPRCRHGANGCSDCGYYEDEAMQVGRKDRRGFDCRAQSSQGRPTLKAVGLTLRALMKEGLMEPGQGVLRVEYKGHVFLGDLTPLGLICYEGELFESPTSWSTHVKRSVVPSYKGDKDAWKSVFYVTEDGEKITLDQLRGTHVHKMFGFGSFEKETATAPKARPELAARAPAAEQAECCPVHQHQAHADPLGGLASPALLSREHDPSYHGVECVQPSPSSQSPLN